MPSDGTGRDAPGWVTAAATAAYAAAGLAAMLFLSLYVPRSREDGLTLGEVADRLTRGGFPCSPAAAGGETYLVPAGFPAGRAAAVSRATDGDFGGGAVAVREMPSEGAAVEVAGSQPAAMAWGRFVFRGADDTLARIRDILGEQPLPPRPGGRRDGRG